MAELKEDTYRRWVDISNMMILLLRGGRKSKKTKMYGVHRTRGPVEKQDRIHISIKTEEWETLPHDWKKLVDVG